MSPFFHKRSTPPVPAKLKAEIEPYLLRLYGASRQALFLILLGDNLPPKEPFPSDPARSAGILQRIETLIATDKHLDGCREKIGERFPGRLAVMFNLADKDDQLFPNESLRKSILDHVRRHQADLSGQPIEPQDVKAIEQLKESSQLQQQLAYLVNYTPNKWLLEQEIPVILESRQRRLKDPSQPAEINPNSAPTSSLAALPGGESTHRDDPYAWSRDKGRLIGLCLSGGGIRSATFNLGILQGLASKNLLRRFDYCSSVSGGGYIHQWFAAWVKREEALHPGASGTPGLDAVCRQMIPLPEPGCGPESPEPIRWLRSYSNYLTPRTGIFSADTWATVATWMRNTFLNQIVLVSFLLCLLLIPHLFLLPNPEPSLTKIGDPHAATTVHILSRGAAEALALLLFVLFSYLLMVRSLAVGMYKARIGKACDTRLDDKSLGWSVVFPSLVVSIIVSDFGFYFAPPGISENQQAEMLCLFAFVGLLVLTWALTKAGGAMDSRPTVEGDRPFRRVIGFTLAAVLASLAGTGAMLLARNTFVTGNPVHFNVRPAQPAPPEKPNVTVNVSTGDSQQVNVMLHVAKAPAVDSSAASPPERHLKWRLVVVFGPLAVMAIPFLAVILQCGLIGYDFPDWALEWLARVRAWVAMYSVTWTMLVGIALFGHELVNLLIRTGHSWINWTALGSWVLATAASVLIGKSSSSDGESGASKNARLANILIEIGPLVYILGLLLLLSWVAQEALQLAGISSGKLSMLDLCLALGVVIGVPLATFFLFGWRVDINEFSLHSYYRNRLARCYLGASNAARDPDPLTGFDNADVDGMNLSSFLPSQGYTGPLPVFCAALNISVGEDLAWQQRKAASFAFSPLLSGYHVPWTGKAYGGQLSFNGFVPTERFAYPNGGIHISTATAISGAAVSPDMGYHTSTPMAFLLTMFNVRLGWWLPNPRRSFLAFDPKGQPPPGVTRYPRPGFAPNELLRELLGQIGDDREFVYLTDGGHFDNMGLYEMVRRRCYEIVICDAEQDDGPVFEGIGMAIRKCRIDFGVEIELDLNKLAIDAATRMSKVHWIIGTIRYPETGDAQPGTILYIKSSITNNEAGDVYNYRLQHTSFPQDSTADQWFTESQFESYRRLGQQVVDQCPYLASRARSGPFPH